MKKLSLKEQYLREKEKIYQSMGQENFPPAQS